MEISILDNGINLDLMEYHFLKAHSSMNILGAIIIFNNYIIVVIINQLIIKPCLNLNQNKFNPRLEIKKIYYKRRKRVDVQRNRYQKKKKQNYFVSFLIQMKKTLIKSQNQSKDMSIPYHAIPNKKSKILRKKNKNNFTKKQLIMKIVIVINLTNIKKLYWP